MHLVIPAGQQRAQNRLVFGGSELVIGLQPRPETDGQDRRRIEKDIFRAEVQLVDVVGGLVVEPETLDDRRILDAVPLKTDRQAPVGGSVSDPESVDLRELDGHAVPEQHTARWNAEIPRLSGRQFVGYLDLGTLPIDTADAPAVCRMPEETPGQRPVGIARVTGQAEQRSLRQIRVRTEDTLQRVVIDSENRRFRVEGSVVIRQPQADVEALADPVGHRQSVAPDVETAGCPLIEFPHLAAVAAAGEDTLGLPEKIEIRKLVVVQGQ